MDLDFFISLLWERRSSKPSAERAKGKAKMVSFKALVHYSTRQGALILTAQPPFM